MDSGYDFDWNDVDPSARDKQETRYPRVWWVNGNSKYKQAGGIVYTGGMGVKMASLSDGEVTVPNWERGGFTAGNDEIVTLETRYPVIAVVRYRRRWVLYDNKKVVDWFPITQKHQPHFKTQIEAVGFIKGWDAPVCFDLSGYASSGLLDSIADHNTRIVSVANQSAPEGKTLPPYAFWLRLVPGKHQQVGGSQKSDATLPELFIPEGGITPDYIKKIYVGKELLIRQQQLFRELDEWAAEWHGAPVMNGQYPAINSEPDPQSNPVTLQQAKRALESQYEEDQGYYEPPQSPRTNKTSVSSPPVNDSDIPF